VLCGLFELQYAVGEGVAVDEVSDEFVAVETTPVPFSLGRQFEDHGQGGDPGATAFRLVRLVRTVMDRGEGRLDGVGRA
jgi:hypothetical protein